MTLRRFWWLIFVILVPFWVISASRIGSVESCLQDCTSIHQHQGRSLRIMSLNILHGFPLFHGLTSRLDRIAAEIRRLDVDLILLQEVPSNPVLGSGAKYLAERTGLNYVYLPANGNRWTILFAEGEAILSRYTLTDVAHVELQPKAGFFEHRIALQVTAKTPWGAIRVVSTHLTNGKAETNRAQTQSLTSFIPSNGEGTFIIAGDFNAREDSPQIEDLARVWIDTYRNANPDRPGFTCCIDNLTTGLDEKLEERIDYLFLIPDRDTPIQLVASQRVFDQPYPINDGWQWASDHVGILTTLKFGN
jgi:endonuclease/exonuclease/phosphatase family metal-dependent hydrolase